MEENKKTVLIERLNDIDKIKLLKNKNGNKTSENKSENKSEKDKSQN